MKTAQPKRVFLSCVSREYGIDRSAFKQEVVRSGIDLRIQEDFERTASPFGTLGKIYRFIKDCDLVVQLIGPTPPQKVRIEVAQEVLDLDPNFARWLAQRAIMPALKAGNLGYTDFEAYLALYLGKPFLPIRFRRGAQSEHEKVLRDLGRHVEVSIDQFDGLAPQIRNALEISSIVNQSKQVSIAAWRRLFMEVGTAFFILIAVAACFVLQFSATGATSDFGSLIDSAAKFAVVFSVYFGLHLATMGDLLVFSFRLKASLRNGTAMLLGFSALGWLLSVIDDFVNTAGSTWPRLISAAILIGIGGTLIEYAAKKTDTRKLVVRTAYASAHSVLLLALLHWGGWSFDLLYWIAVIGGALVLTVMTRRDADDLEREREHGTSNLTPGITENADGCFWYERHVIEQARRVPDFQSKV